MLHGDHSRKLRELFALLKERGFAVADVTGKKHRKYKISAPNGQGFLWVVGSTPSDQRAWLNATQTLRRWLADCGYADERRYLRIDSAVPSARDLRSVYDLLDAIDAAVTRQEGRSP